MTSASSSGYDEHDFARIVEEGAGEVEDAEERRALEEGVATLHELFVTDVTRS